MRRVFILHAPPVLLTSYRHRLLVGTNPPRTEQITRDVHADHGCEPAESNGETRACPPASETSISVLRQYIEQQDRPARHRPWSVRLRPA